MSVTPFRSLLVLVVMALALLAEEKTPALQRTGTSVSAVPQSLAERAKTMRVNKAGFDDFRRPQVLFELDPTPSPEPPTVPSPGGPQGTVSGGPLPQARRVNPLGEYVNAKANAESTQRCPKATAEQKQAVNERLEKATQSFERAKAQYQQRQQH